MAMVALLRDRFYEGYKIYVQQGYYPIPDREVMQDIVDRGIDEGAFMPGLRLDGQRAMWAAIDGLSAQAMFGVHPMDTESAGQAIARTLDLCLTDLLTERAIQARAAVDLPPGIITDARV